jgi:NAD(P)-dependent dehydrogenase (short-subunit alcohol dehydrogenase family)
MTKAPAGGRVYWITGGTSGIGLAVASLLVEQGHRVFVSGRDQAIGARAEAVLGGRPQATFLPADVARQEDLAAAVAQIEAEAGRLDGLVTAAGIGVVAPLLDTDPEDFDAIQAVNVRGTWLAIKLAMPLLLASEGAVVTVASDAALIGEAVIGAYSVSKAAVLMLTRMLAMDCAPRVRVNAVAPGYTEPGMRHMPHRAGPPPAPDPLPPLGRYAQGRDVAEVVAFLLGPGSRHMTGSVVAVDGGQKAGVR